MSPGDRRPLVVSILRNRLMKVETLADLAARTDELSTAVPQQQRLDRSLGACVDRLEHDVFEVLEARLEHRRREG